MDPFTIALLVAGVGVSAFSAWNNWYFGNKSNDRQDAQLNLQQQQLGLQQRQYDLQEQSLGLQEQSLNETLRSNYYSYMQQLNSMQGELGQNQIAINQQYENIASNMNYLDRWSSEYDMSMQNGIDESFNQYQQLASNYASGLVSNAETGRRGGTAGRAVGDSASQVRSLMGGDGSFTLQGNRLGSFLQSTAMDMLSDRQTAISSIGTSYKSIGSYQDAMDILNGNIGSMQNTTEQMKDKLAEKGLEV